MRHSAHAAHREGTETQTQRRCRSESDWLIAAAASGRGDQRRRLPLQGDMWALHEARILGACRAACAIGQQLGRCASYCPGRSAHSQRAARGRGESGGTSTLGRFRQLASCDTAWGLVLRGGQTRSASNPGAAVGTPRSLRRWSALRWASCENAQLSVCIDPKHRCECLVERSIHHCPRTPLPGGGSCLHSRDLGNVT